MAAAAAMNPILKKRFAVPAALLLVVVFVLFTQHGDPLSYYHFSTTPSYSPPTALDDGTVHWDRLPLHYPVPPESMISLPAAPARRAIPKIQHEFGRENATDKKIRLERLALVKSNFTHAWNGYKEHAWLNDEVRPLSGGAYNGFGGWAATLVDSLDTLWIMGLKSEFELAVRSIELIDFNTSPLEEINVFETTIRYLGGFLAAYDLTKGKYPSLLRKAVELADMLYIAFDTPNRMPITRWKFKEARARTAPQTAPDYMLVAELGSLTLEFTRLSQLTGNPKYYDAVQRVMDVFEDQQDKTKLPGLWPVLVNAASADFTTDSGFTIGGMADSLYEYLPKEYILLGGAVPQYRDLYVKALAAMKRNIFYRPRTKSGVDMLLPGDVRSEGTRHPATLETTPRTQHLSCFAGGMVGLAARALSMPKDLKVARQLVEGCLWAYENSPSGIMPEILHTTRCPRAKAAGAYDDCPWDESQWHKEIALRLSKGVVDAAQVRKVIEEHRLTPGITSVDDTRYMLRPEAIESVFVLYRLTGEQDLADRAWRMFETIVAATRTEIAHAALSDCTAPQPARTRTDSMESFWLAETLKYFYLIFESPDVVSLDEYVLNTEAHPLRRVA